MEVKIKEKVCPGCGQNMPAIKVSHGDSKLACIEWGCGKCNRQFSFAFIQDTEELPGTIVKPRIEHYR